MISATVPRFAAEGRFRPFAPGEIGAMTV